MEIVRAFVRLRRVAGSVDHLRRKLESLEARYDARFKAVFDAIRSLMDPPAAESPRPPIGFRPRPG